MTEHLERAELRDAFRAAFGVSGMANKRFQEGEPWKARTQDPAKAASLIRDLCYVLKDLSILMHPYIPRAADRLAGFFGLRTGAGGLSWKDLGVLEGLGQVGTPEVLFSKLEDDRIAELRERYAGSQKERADRESAKASEDAAAAGKAPLPAAAPGNPAAPEKAAEPAVPPPMPYAELPAEERFAKLVDLRAAKIVKIERHPKADKLYIETLDDGSGAERIIVSGLVPFYKEEELLGKTIVLVNNLKPAKLRGTESRGMLLAASKDGPEGHEIVEVLEASWAEPGARVSLESTVGEPSPEIDIDTFFSMPIRSEGGTVKVGPKVLGAEGRPLTTVRVTDGNVG
ncbi:MAG: hypothetical protein MZU95_08925 [Desulfomicrobium escambiense]|nr:hypothetical protein [Desulfomicrobium escambiense]